MSNQNETQNPTTDNKNPTTVSNTEELDTSQNVEEASKESTTDINNSTGTEGSTEDAKGASPDGNNPSSSLGKNETVPVEQPKNESVEAKPVGPVDSSEVGEQFRLHPDDIQKIANETAALVVNTQNGQFNNLSQLINSAVNNTLCCHVNHLMSESAKNDAETALLNNRKLIQNEIYDIVKNNDIPDEEKEAKIAFLQKSLEI